MAQKNHHCPYPGCNSSFYRPYRLAQHVLVHNNVKAFRCKEENCSKAYTSNSHLIRHIRLKHKDNPVKEDIIYRCPKCMKKYANRQNLKRHLKVHQRTKNCFVCDTCDVRYKKKNQLNAHMYIHTGVKAFNCKLCPRSFINLYEKRKHMRSHKTYPCPDCSNTFTRWSKYRKHIVTDHTQKEFMCDICERVFKRRSHIIRHIKIHDESKIFFCPYENCKRFYTRNSNLRQHIFMSHERVTYDCVICKAQLSTKKSLREHIIKRHESQPKERTYKTKAEGRKKRKDDGSLKNSTALKLAGLPQEIEEIPKDIKAEEITPCTSIKTEIKL